MTDVPDYLLERSRQARARLTGEALDAPAGDEGAAEPAAAAPAAAAAAAPPVQAPPPEPEVVPPWVEAAESRPRMPYWVVPVIISLPIWAFFYVGSLERPAEEAEGLLSLGSVEYASCSACHGAQGGGVNGPGFTDGAVVATFPTIEGHIEWVVKGTEAYGPGRPYGSPAVGRVSGGIGVMPGFGAALDKEHMLAVVLHERAALSGSEVDVVLAEVADELIESGELVLEGSWTETFTPEQIREELEPMFARLEDEFPEMSAELAAGAA